MPETFETTNLRDQLQSAYAEKDGKKLLYVLESIYCALTDCDGIPEEVKSVLRGQLDPALEQIEGKGFLDDPHKLDLEIPLAEGGDPHLTLYREEDGGLRLMLKGDRVNQDMVTKFEMLGLGK